VSEILSNKDPVLFSLIDLKKEPLEGYFYSAQLTKTEKPKDKSYFLIEKILGHKFVNKKKYFLVKYLYYDNRFNEYVLESDITKNFEETV
jgi:hypothetical protein